MDLVILILIIILWLQVLGVIPSANFQLIVVILLTVLCVWGLGPPQVQSWRVTRW